MANDIKEALKKAVQKTEVGTIVEGEGSEEVHELSHREKMLMARKKNLQRQKRSRIPSSLR